jgi:hypothetical protein
VANWLLFFCAGVLEVNFVEPAHDKQDFERTNSLSRLEARLVLMQKKYWFVLLIYGMVILWSICIPVCWKKKFLILKYVFHFSGLRIAIV